MPTYNRLRAHYDESLFPFGPEPSHQDPEELIEGCQPWPGMLSLEHRDLLAKSQVLKLCDERGADAGLRLRIAEWRRPSEGAIAFRLWTATLYPVEIAVGQSFGEPHQ